MSAATSTSANASGASRSSDRAGLERVTASFRNWDVLSRVDSADFRKITALLHQATYKPGTHITPLGGHDTTLYIPQSGKLVIRKPTEKYVDNHQPVRLGDIINTEPFLTGQTNEYIIEAIDTVVAWTIQRADWVALLKANPQIELALVFPQAVQVHLDDLARHTWLQPGEKKVLYIKRHWCVFVSSVWASGLAFLVLVGIFIGFRGLLDTRLFLYLWLTIAVLALGNVVWQLIDWQNDYFAVTDRRVIHQERVLFFSSVKEEAPLDRIQTITVQQLTMESSLYGVGDVVMSQIGSDSKIVFSRIANPSDVGKAVAKQQQRYKISDRVLEREKIREDIRAAINVKDRPSDVPGPSEVKVLKSKSQLSKLKELRPKPNPLLGSAWPSARFVSGDNIIYRKHWLELAETIWLPILLTLVFVAGLALFVLRVPDIGASIRTSPVILIIPAIIGSALLVWLWYEYEDWRNDIFVVSKKSVIDIDRKPLGRSTQRRETTLDKVQAVTANTRGVLDSFFNVGDVVIKTGATDQLVFTRVSDPQSVQADISLRLDEFKKSALEEEAKKRRAEFREWFHIYDEMSKLHYDGQGRG